jgi:hypothetical protein
MVLIGENLKVDDFPLIEEAAWQCRGIELASQGVPNSNSMRSFRGYDCRQYGNPFSAIPPIGCLIQPE